MRRFEVQEGVLHSSLPSPHASVAEEVLGDDVGKDFDAFGHFLAEVRGGLEHEIAGVGELFEVQRHQVGEEGVRLLAFAVAGVLRGIVG